MSVFTENFVAARDKPGRSAGTSVLLSIFTVLIALSGKGLGMAVGTWRKIRTTVMSYTGFALITAAAWQAGVVWGLLTAGVSILVIELLGGKG